MYYKGLGIFLLRLFIGVRLIYGVWDNIISWDRMLEFKAFLASQNFPLPLVSAIASVYAQFICALLILAGWKIKWAALAMIINFVIAAYIELPRGFEAMTPALAILFSNIVFFLEGPGKFAIGKK